MGSAVARIGYSLVDGRHRSRIGRRLVVVGIMAVEVVEHKQHCRLKPDIAGVDSCRSVNRIVHIVDPGSKSGVVADHKVAVVVLAVDHSKVVGHYFLDSRMDSVLVLVTDSRPREDTDILDVVCKVVGYYTGNPPVSTDRYSSFATTLCKY